jgi:hypothetical protein
MSIYYRRAEVLGGCGWGELEAGAQNEIIDLRFR